MAALALFAGAFAAVVFVVASGSVVVLPASAAAAFVVSAAWEVDFVEILAEVVAGLDSVVVAAVCLE